MNWLISCPYSPYKNIIANHLTTLSQILHLHSSSCYGKFIIPSDLNVAMAGRKIRIIILQSN